MKIRKIELAWIVVSDLNKAKSFYTDILGLDIYESSEEYGWLEVKGNSGGAALGIAKGDGHGPVGVGQNAVVTLTVDNFDETIEELKSKGVKFIGDVIEIPDHAKMIFFVDADGNNFQLVEARD
ncbi:VOC family protein [Candidatus Babeliales bacterium]|nr:VOC family protein [Candidatus Babeliales bacterium]